MPETFPTEEASWEVRMKKFLKDLILEMESKTTERPRQNTASHGAGQQTNRENNNCYNCGESGHFANKCPHPRKEKTSDQTTERRCHNCNQTGHLIKNCPKSNAHVSMITSESNTDDIHEEVSNKEQEPDDGNLERTILNPPG
nr:protein lin-28 homolog [Lytechinus pictus]